MNEAVLLVALTGCGFTQPGVDTILDRLEALTD
jgi:hypothetical protein